MAYPSPDYYHYVTFYPLRITPAGVGPGTGPLGGAVADRLDVLGALPGGANLGDTGIPVRDGRVSPSDAFDVGYEEGRRWGLALVANGLEKTSLPEGLALVLPPYDAPAAFLPTWLRTYGEAFRLGLRDAYPEEAYFPPCDRPDGEEVRPATVVAYDSPPFQAMVLSLY